MLPLWFWLWCAFYNRPLKKHIILFSKCTSRLADKRIHIKLVSSALCTFSVMGLSMCSSPFSESSPVRSKSDIINELSGFSNSFQQCDAATPAQAGMVLPAMHIAFALLGKTLVLSAEFGTKIKFDLSTFIQKLLVFIKNYSTTHRSDKMSHFSYLEILISGESYQSKTRYTYSNWCNSITKKYLDLR